VIADAPCPECTCLTGKIGLVRKDGPSIRLLCGVHPENFGECQSESEMEREKLALAERIGLRESFRILKWRDRTPLLAECDRCQLKFITPAPMLRDDPQAVEYLPKREIRVPHVPSSQVVQNSRCLEDLERQSRMRLRSPPELSPSGASAECIVDYSLSLMNCSRAKPKIASGVVTCSVAACLSSSNFCLLIVVSTAHVPA
jgi:hypothetical protein